MSGVLRGVAGEVKEVCGGIRDAFPWIRICRSASRMYPIMA